MHVENESSLVFVKMVAWLLLISVTFVQKPNYRFMIPVLHVHAICSLQPTQKRHKRETATSFTPTLGGALFLCKGLVLPPRVSTYQDIWPSPLSAPWQASASPLTS